MNRSAGRARRRANSLVAAVVMAVTLGAVPAAQPAALGAAGEVAIAATLDVEHPESPIDPSRNCATVILLRWPHVEQALRYRIVYTDSFKPGQQIQLLPTHTSGVDEPWRGFPYEVPAPAGMHQKALTASAKSIPNPPCTPPALDPGRFTILEAVAIFGAPTAAFSYEVDATDPLTVHFDASGSTGAELGYDWDFGDGETGSGMTTSHTYDDAGSYDVSLTVTDNAARTDVATDAVELRAISVAGSLAAAPALLSLTAPPAGHECPGAVEPPCGVVELRARVTNDSEDPVDNVFAASTVQFFSADDLGGGLSAPLKLEGPLPSDDVGSLQPGETREVVYRYQVQEPVHLIARVAFTYERPNGSTGVAQAETTFRAVEFNPTLEGSLTYEVPLDHGGVIERHLESENGVLEGEIFAGDLISYRGEDFDPDGGPIVVSLLGNHIAQHPAGSEIEGEFELAAYPLTSHLDNACVVELVATQSGHSVALSIRGEPIARVIVAGGDALVDGSSADVGDFVCRGSRPGVGGNGYITAGSLETDGSRPERVHGWGGLWLSVRRPGIEVDIEGGLATPGIMIGGQGSPPVLFKVPTASGDHPTVPRGTMNGWANDGVCVTAGNIPHSPLLMDSDGRLYSATTQGYMYCRTEEPWRFTGQPPDECTVPGNPLGHELPHATIGGSFIFHDVEGSGMIGANLMVWIVSRASLQPCPRLVSLFAPMLIVGAIPGFTHVAGGKPAPIVGWQATAHGSPAGVDRGRRAGRNRLAVMTTDGFAPGDRIAIDPGGPRQEFAVVTGLGSLLLDRRLKHDHPPGTLVVNLSNPPSGIEIPAIGPKFKSDCKRGGWKLLGFRNQGHCVHSVTSRGPGGSRGR